MKKILFLLLILCLIPSISFGACSTACTKASTTYTCTDVSRDCIQDAVTAATAGDTILFDATPASATWSSGVTIEKAITINGNSHTLTSSGTLGSTGFFKITGFTADETQVRITGFTFSMASASYGIVVTNMTGGPTVGQIRIDHNTFQGGGQQVYFYHGKGLIDNNYFYNGVKAMDLSAGSRSDADASWLSLAAGTPDAIYIESNHFIKNASWPGGGHQEQIGTENGGKLVIRYNDFNFTAVPDKGENVYAFMAHGNAQSGGDPGYWESSSDARRGQSVIEFYNNAVTINNQRFDFLYQTRGSVNLVYNNTITGTATYSPVIHLWEEEYGANFSGPTTHQRTAWPAEDQVHNSFFWNNTYNGSARFNIADHFIVNPNASVGLLKDRDFFLHKPCGASDSVDAYRNTCTHGKATFTGANGASGSYPTDGNTYPTEGTMVFTSTGDNAYYGYTPYAYPHPLRGESGSGSYMITIAKSGDGTGTVTEGENINCGETCAYDYYLYDGQEIEFTSTPATGSYVSGWSGCTQQADPTKCKLNVSADATVTASFTNGRKATLGAGGGTITLGP